MFLMHKTAIMRVERTIVNAIACSIAKYTCVELGL